MNTAETMTAGGKPGRRLLLFHTPGAEARTDWETVVERIAARAPDIEARIATNSPAVEPAWDADDGRPLLVVAPHELRRPWQGRGRVFAGVSYGKFAQAERLKAAGLPVPPTRLLRDWANGFGRSWGEFAVVKPDQGHLGEGVRLLRNAALPALISRMPADRRAGFVVQPYIEHADLAGRSFEYRILVFFGRLVYCAMNGAPSPHAPLARIAASTGIIASNAANFGRRTRRLSAEPEVIRLALAAAAAFPELPVSAVDIIRARDGGALYILETNPRGESWHLSSDFSVNSFDPLHRAALYSQYDALNVVADALIGKTRAEAV